MDDGEVGKMVEEIIVVGCISFDGKSDRFCLGIPISLSLGMAAGISKSLSGLITGISPLLGGLITGISTSSGGLIMGIPISLGGMTTGI